MPRNIAAGLLVLSGLWSGAHATDILTGESFTTSVQVFNITKAVESACGQLSTAFPEKVLTPDSANYTLETKNYWDIRSDQHPRCIFLPGSAGEVAEAVKVVHDQEAPFAIRGGGHMNFPGSNNIDSGVLIALSNLHDVKVNAETIEVGPGLRWYEVYEALSPHDRITLGGRLKTIGVPGLTLIGGFHYFINKYGFVMDQVDSYDVVLGNGTQVTANATVHPDLFWALKGGANNFGIVTKFVLKTYEMAQVSSTIQMYDESQIPAFIKAVTDMAEVDNVEDPVAAGGVLTIGYNTTTGATSATLMGLQEGVSNPPSEFANFTAIPGSVKMHNVTTAAAFASTLETPNQMFRVMFSHHTIKPDADVLNEIYQAWKSAVGDVADVNGLAPTFVMNVVPRGAARVGKTNGIGNVWGLDDDQAWIIWQLSTSWAREQDDLRMEAWSRQLVTALHEKYKPRGITSEFVYMGDAGEWQDPFLGFPAENVQRLKETRARYDPDGVFSKLNWGGFKMGPSV